MKFLGIILAATLTLSMFACKDKDAEKKLDDIKAEVKNPQLTDNWIEAKCQDTNIFGSPIKSTRTRFEFHGTDVTRIVDFYSNQGCADLAGQFRYTGTYEQKENIANGIYALDMYFKNASVVANNESGKKILNLLNFCGNKDWQVNVVVDRTAESKNTLCPLDDTPVNYFDIYLVEDGRLYFGVLQGDSKKRPENRPTQVDREHPYIKN